MTVTNSQTVKKKKGFFSYLQLDEGMRVFYSDSPIDQTDAAGNFLFHYQEDKHTPILKDYSIYAMIVNTGDVTGSYTVKYGGAVTLATSFVALSALSALLI
jgi:hypothetical protein